MAARKGKSHDQRKKSLWKRATEREYGGKDYRDPQNRQDTGKSFGRREPSRGSSPPRMGPRF